MGDHDLLYGLLNDYREPVWLMFHYDIFVQYGLFSRNTLEVLTLSISCGMTPVLKGMAV